MVPTPCPPPPFMRGDGTHCSAGFLKLRVYIEMGVEHRMLVLASRVAIRSPQLAGRACQFLLPPAHTKRAHGADMGIAVGTASEEWCDDRNECCHTA